MKRKILIAVLSAIAASALCGFVFTACSKNVQSNNQTTPAETIASNVNPDITPPTPNDMANGCAHEYSAWTVGYAPTCTSIGYDVRTCEKCGDTDYRFFDAKGHTPIQVNYNQSIHIYECKTCGELITAEHDFDENETCTFCKYVADYTLSLTFVSIDNKSYSVKAANKDTLENVIIPSTHKGLPVTEIAMNAFMSCKNLKSVVIPEGVTKINNVAFYNCPNLTDITFPKSLKEIGNFVFNNCTSLTELILPENLTNIGYGIFRSCTALTNISIPSDWTAIPQRMYEKCTGLETIEIPDHITSISHEAFSDCSALKSVKFSDNVTNIGNRVFIRCTALESVELPVSLTELGSQAFSYCTSLKSVILNEKLTSIGSSAFNGCTTLESIELPASLLEIGSNVFDGTTIKKIVLKEGATVFGGFGGCGTLVEVVLPESLTLICAGALPNYDGLTRITFNGTMAQWKAVEKQSGWKSPDNIITNFFVDCTDGTLEYIW